MRFLLIALMLLLPLAAKAQPYQVVSSCGTVSNPGAIGSGMGGYIDMSGNICVSASGSSLNGADASGANVTATGGNTARTTAARAADVFNIADYGAKCDGSTNDDAAINATLTAAKNSNAYQNNNQVVITGPAGIGLGCVMNSLNYTQFNKGTGANTRARVVSRNMRLLCTGAGNVCLDGLGADFLRFENVTVRGDSVAPPAICLQVGVISATSAAWNTTEGLSCNNNFTFTALYNFASEANTYNNSFFVNSYSATGPIGTLGSITAGSGFTSGTYAGTALTGGTGTGAIATISAGGGVVTAVAITYQGQGYTPGDVLTASVGGGTGFSVPVATVKPYTAVLDGQNHWRANSIFATETLPVDTWQSMTLVAFHNSHFRQLASGGGVWSAWTSGMTIDGLSYILNGSGSSCLDLFNNGVTKSGIPYQNASMTVAVSCEGASLTSAVNLTGSNATPTLFGFNFKGGSAGNTALFSTDSNITAVSAPHLTVDVQYEPNLGTPMFSNAKIWSVSGDIEMAFGSMWNAPNSFMGNLVIGTLATPPGAMGPVDLMSGAAQAVSCARQLSLTYTGPLCQLHRASDSTNMDIYPTTSGGIDRNAVTAFCAATTCTVATMYDQSGNGNNFTQTTVASQPTYTTSVAALNNKPALLFGDASAIAMTAAASASINDIFATGGYVSMVYDQTVNTTVADRILYKSNGGNPGIGFDYRFNAGGQSQLFKVGAVTTAGSWTTQSPSAFGISPGQGLISDLQYSFASASNLPVVGFNSNVPTLPSQTQPVGSATTDAAFALLLGNSVATAGVAGFPGYIAESIIWKATPTSAQLEAIRRNQAAFYGIASVN